MNSLWSTTAERPRFRQQEGDLNTDVLIVGGGMAGLLCAYYLSLAGIDYILVEAKQLCDGITQHTTAKITIQHGLLYHKLIRRFGQETARNYLLTQQGALERYRQLCQSMDCDFENIDSFVYSLNDPSVIRREVAALDQLGLSASFVSSLPLPIAVAGAVQVKRQAQFHPLRFAFSLAKQLNILEHTKVLELRPEGALTNRGRIRSKRTIITTHFPILNKHGGYFLKLYQHRSYVLALQNTPSLSGTYVDEADTGLSFRRYGNLLLLGGGGHRTGKQGGNWRELENVVRRHYPDAREAGRWATQDCMTLDGLPYIGSYSKHTPNLYVATGFNKWGMTSSMVAASLLTDLIQGKPNPYAAVFSPHRTILRPQLAINAAESLLNLLTPTAPRCPHLGCALKYNPAEHSWDCPCHGSRFTASGQLIDGPATDDFK